jgi:quinol monooxygenase YgiN
MKSKFLAHGSLLAKESNIEEMINILLEASEICTGKFDCDAYLVSTDPSEPNRIWITELWHSEDEMNKALQDDSVRALITKAMPMLQEPPKKGQRLTIHNSGA